MNVTSEKEIEKRAEDLSVSGLILPKNYLAGPREKVVLTPSENELLNSAIQMMGHSFASLHVNLHLMGVNAPLMSVYMHSTHLFALFFQKQGIRVAELLSPGDIATVLVQCVNNMPSSPEERVLFSTKNNLDDAISAIETNIMEGTEKVRDALGSQTSITFWLTGLTGEYRAMAVNLGDEVCNLIEAPEGVKLVFGSAAHSVMAVNEWALKMFQQCVKSFQKE